MVKNIKGLHHYHVRKRIHEKHEPYPHPNKWKRLMDKIIYPVAFAGPIMTLPQVYNIWIKKNASGVSIISWSSYLLFSMLWLTYGLMHKEKPIIYSSILWVILELLLVAGLLIY
ncbi:MAG: SemiSWEET family transporter [archaeon]